MGQIEPAQTDCLDEQDALSALNGAANTKIPQYQAFINTHSNCLTAASSVHV